MQEYPIIKLEIDRMKQTIMHHFGLMQRETSEAVEREIERVIENYDFGAAVTKAAVEVMDSAIKSYFQYGDGRRFIEESLQEALKRVFGKEG